MPDGSNPDRPRRAQSQTERDLEGLRALKERNSAVPEFAEEVNTGVMRDQGATREEILAARSRRLTPQRLSKIEAEQYDQGEKLAETREDVASIKATQTSHGSLLTEIRDDLRDRRKDELDARKNNRARITEAFKWALSGGGLIYILHKLGAL